MNAINRLASGVAERVEGLTSLDRVAGPLADRVSGLFQRARLKDLLSGSWFGHPLHPLLTDLPIGSWTSAFLLDLFGGRRARPAADLLVAVGVVTAIPTAATGLSDWSDLGQEDRRTGLVHATANTVALALYIGSLVARARDRRGAGVMLGLAGATMATAGGFLGGHLVYRRGAGVDHTTFEAGADEWAAIEDVVLPGDGEMTMATVAGVDVMVSRQEATLCGLSDRCSHQGGPLHEGTLVDGRVRCPWHASEFQIADGSVVHGPATADQPVYDLRTVDGVTQVRRRMRGRQN